MAVTINPTPAPGAQGYYTVPATVTRILPDGRVLLVAAAGTRLPLAQAIRLGLTPPPAPPVSPAPPPAPTEIKADAPPPGQEDQ